MRPHDWLRARRWWRWQTSAAAAGLMLSATALVAVATGAADERSDIADANAARLRSLRADYEAECRFQLNLDVLEIEGAQLDGMSDLLSALAREDMNAALAVVVHLAELKQDKDQAEADRRTAVATCNAEARNLYPSPG